jgi:hypothetical protein
MQGNGAGSSLILNIPRYGFVFKDLCQFALGNGSSQLILPHT